MQIKRSFISFVLDKSMSAESIALMQKLAAV